MLCRASGERDGVGSYVSVNEEVGNSSGFEKLKVATKLWKRTCGNGRECFVHKLKGFIVQHVS